MKQFNNIAIISMKVGAAFPDFIKTEKPPKLFHEGGFGKKSKIRSYLLPLFLFLFLFIILIKLISLSIFQGSYYRNLSDNNRMRTNIIYAPRGVILDRNGTPLVFNIPGFRKEINGKMRLLTRDEANFYIATGAKDLEIDSLREYPYKEETAHILGFLGQISDHELKDKKYSEYSIKDIIGKTGIEKEYEKKLRGRNGKQLSEVDAGGKTVRTLGKIDPVAGEDVKLTIDLKLQRRAFTTLKDIEKGAIIVSNPKGEILTLVSKPSFDPNLFTMGDQYKTSTVSSYKTVEEVLTDDENQPLLNRSISGVYPPGSTFKLVTAAAGLEEKVIDENFKIEDTGVLRVGNFSFANWYYTDYGKTEGEVDVVKAIKRSNDIFFYKVGNMLGVEKLSTFALKFGLGGKLGIDLDGEAKGLVPTKKWKEKEIGEPWYLGDDYHYGIGQGYLLTTPLQVNSWTQAIANSGNLYVPHLLKTQNSNRKTQNFLSEKTVSLIRQGMVESCETGGVGWPLFEFKIPAFVKAPAGKQNSKYNIDGKNFLKVPESTVSAKFNDYVKVSIACKTGTAQHGGEETIPHAWITLFAPAYDPEIIVTVLAESSGQGSNIAAPIAKKILEEWFSR